MSIEEQKAALDDLRSDPRKTAERYDEIISLRMFLLDIHDVLKNEEEPKLRSLAKRIHDRSKRWGKKGDCA
jgi:hypothetical protein